MKYIHTVFTLLLFFATASLFAQGVPAPAQDQSQTIVLQGGTIHVGDGNVYENGTIIFENGKITEVLETYTNKINNDYQYIDVSGKHVYPGLISPNSLLGMIEINAVRATRDNREVGKYNPHIRSVIAYNTDSKVIPTVRSNGVLLAQVRPEGGTISGQSSIVQLDAWNWEDAIVKADDAIYMNWPSLYRRGGWWAEPGNIELNKKYDEQVDDIKGFFSRSKAYTRNIQDGQLNLKMKSMDALMRGDKKLFIVANQHKQIVDAVLLAKEYGINMVLVGGRDAWLVMDILKENNIPVVLRPTHQLPYVEDEDVDQAFKLPVMLEKAGIDFCLSAPNGHGAQRNLPFNMGKAVAYGLDKEAALSAITLNTAEILGLGDRLGLLEVGKDATIVVSDGDILDVIGNNVTHAFIQGRAINLGNKQKDLYKKFMDKYELDYEKP